MSTAGAVPPHALVLGASGFIGRALVRQLLARGARVTAVVRTDVPVSNRLTTIRTDLEASGAASAVVASVRPTHVFNLAGYGVDRSEVDEARADHLNHRLPRELADACAPRAGVAGPVLVHVGSAAEYGSVGGVFTESGDARPFTTYGRTKLAGTRAVTDVAATRGTMAVTARLFTVFGDGEHDGRLFPSLLAAAAARRPIDLSDGQQQRDFGWVSDVADALVALGTTSFGAGEVVNIASGRLHTVEAFVRAAAQALGIPADDLRFGALPARGDEMAHDGVSVARMRALLGDALPADLGETVQRAVADIARPA